MDDATWPAIGETVRHETLGDCKVVEKGQPDVVCLEFDGDPDNYLWVPVTTIGPVVTAVDGSVAMSDSDETTVWVLLKETDNGDTSVHAVYRTREALDARMDRIAQRNSQYPLERKGDNAWRIGPEEDEGFFGNKPLWFRAVEKELR